MAKLVERVKNISNIVEYYLIDECVDIFNDIDYETITTHCDGYCEYGNICVVFAHDNNEDTYEVITVYDDNIRIECLSADIISFVNERVLKSLQINNANFIQKSNESFNDNCIDNFNIFNIN